MNYISGLGSVSTIWLEPPLTDGFTCKFQPMGAFVGFTGTKSFSYLYGAYGQRIITANYFIDSRSKYKTFVDFFKDRQGELKKFWTLNWLNEFTLSRQIYINIDSALAYIVNCGFSERYDGNIRVFMLMKNGDLIIRKVTQSKYISADEESMVFDCGVPYNILPSDVAMFGRVLLVRLVGDLQMDISMADNTVLYAKTSLTMMELPHEYKEV